MSARTEWFDSARGTLAPVELPPAADARLDFRAGTYRWHLVIEAGRVTQFAEGPVPDPDVELRWDLQDAIAILGRRLSGDDALTRTEVIALDASGDRYTGPPAPGNLACRRELERLPAIPGATFTVQYRYRAGPFGDCSYRLSFEDGRLVREAIGELPGADAVVEVSYRAMALVRAGELTILDALMDGNVDGSIGVLAALAGISESPEFQAAERATGRQAFALAALGELGAHELAGDLMRDLAGQLAEP